MRERILVKGLCKLKSAVPGQGGDWDKAQRFPTARGEHSNSNNKNPTLFHDSFTCSSFQFENFIVL